MFENEKHANFQGQIVGQRISSRQNCKQSENFHNQIQNNHTYIRARIIEPQEAHGTKELSPKTQIFMLITREEDK